VFGLSHQLHEDSTLASTAAAEGTHHLFDLLCEALGLAVEVGAPAAALLGDVVDKCERFFCALYSVVASVTR
jgi:hypothetical protein